MILFAILIINLSCENTNNVQSNVQRAKINYTDEQIDVFYNEFKKVICKEFHFLKTNNQEDKDDNQQLDDMTKEKEEKIVEKELERVKKIYEQIVAKAKEVANANKNNPLFEEYMDFINEYVKEFALALNNNNRKAEAAAEEEIEEKTEEEELKEVMNGVIIEFHHSILDNKKNSGEPLFIFSNKQTNFAKALVRDMSDENKIDKLIECLNNFNRIYHDDPYLEKININLLGNLLRYCNIVEKYNDNATSNSFKAKIYTFVKTLNDYPKDHQTVQKIYEILKIYNISDDFVNKVLNSSKEFEKK
jgi:hypothetical protein